MFYPPHHTRYYPPHMYPPQHYGPPMQWQQHQQMRPHTSGTGGNSGSNNASASGNSKESNQMAASSNQGAVNSNPPPTMHPGGFPYYPYPPRPSSSFMAAFKDKDGKFDFNKTSNTIDQVVKISNQISPIVKQVGSFFTSATKGGGS